MCALYARRRDLVLGALDEIGIRLEPPKGTIYVWPPVPAGKTSASFAEDVLERAGLVSRGKEAQWRPAALEARPLKEIDEWVERYRVNWEQRLDRLDDYLKELHEKGKRHGRKG